METPSKNICLSGVDGPQVGDGVRTRDRNVSRGEWVSEFPSKILWGESNRL